MVPIENVYQQIAELGKRFAVQRVVLFGSRARGDALAKSDIDLAIEGCANAEAFEDAVQNELWSLLEIDVVNLDEPVCDELRAEIARDGKVLYEEVR